MISSLQDKRFAAIRTMASSPYATLIRTKSAASISRVSSAMVGGLVFSATLVYFQHSELDKLTWIMQAVVFATVAAFAAWLAFLWVVRKYEQFFELRCSEIAIATRESLALDVAAHMDTLSPQFFIPGHLQQRIKESENSQLIEPLVNSIASLKAKLQEVAYLLVSTNSAEVANAFLFLYSKTGYQYRLSELEKRALALPDLLEEAVRRAEAEEMSSLAKSRIERALTR